MTQAQAVIETIRRQGGIATLKHIYEHIHEIKDCQWNTKTPEATIRRIVQENEGIIRVVPGYYMLPEFRDKMLQQHQGDQISINTVISRLIAIPSLEARYQTYVTLNTLFHDTVWDKYSGFVLELIKQDTATILNLLVNAHPGSHITINDIHDNTNSLIH